MPTPDDLVATIAALRAQHRERAAALYEKRQRAADTLADCDARLATMKGNLEADEERAIVAHGRAILAEADSDPSAAEPPPIVPVKRGPGRPRKVVPVVAHERALPGTKAEDPAQVPLVTATGETGEAGEATADEEKADLPW